VRDHEHLVRVLERQPTRDDLVFALVMGRTGGTQCAEGGGEVAAEASM
jgi:hypothetical protein